MPGGRPTKYLPEFCEKVVEVGGQGLSLTAFAGTIGVARSTINEWMAEYPEFSEATKRHAAARTAYLERTLLSSEQGPKVTARIFALKNAAPEEWSDMHRVLWSGNVTIDHKAAAQAEVEEIFGPTPHEIIHG
jgi:hypothetical protein